MLRNIFNFLESIGHIILDLLGFLGICFMGLLKVLYKAIEYIFLLLSSVVAIFVVIFVINGVVEGWRAESQNSRQSAEPSLGEYAPNRGKPTRSSTPAWLPDRTGSGLFVNSKGHILTNDHVIAGCVRLRVSPHGGGAVVRARGWDNDLALLQVDAGHGARPVVLRNRRARLGENVVAAGYPLHNLLSGGVKVSPGIVSALSGIGGNSHHLQITAPVQPGNSGGPLFDQSGHVIGVVVSKLNAIRTAQITGDIPQNVNFAIRAEVARAFLDSRHIPYQIARTSTARSTEQIAAKARSHTVLIECWK